MTLAPAVQAAAASSVGHDDGFTLTELLVAMAITLSLMAALFGLAQPAQGIFDAQLELADMQQRLRVGVDVLAHGLLMADAPVMPYRVGRRRPDPERGVFFRADTISVLSVPWDGATVESHTYLSAPRPGGRRVPASALRWRIDRSTGAGPRGAAELRVLRRRSGQTRPGEVRGRSLVPGCDR